MEETIEQLLSHLTEGYFLMQVFVIWGLYLTGVIFLYIIRERMPHSWALLLGFPMGISLWVLGGFFLLIVGIPLHPATIGMLVLLGAVLAGIWRNTYYHMRQILDKDWKNKWQLLKLFCFGSVLVFAGTILAVSGLLRVSISNDSVYYYSMYPMILVEKGRLLPVFDSFLTDAGQGTAVLGTLPFFFGFEQSFGIQRFLGLNFLLIFVLAVYEEALKCLSRKKALIVTAMSSLFLATSAPFIIMEKWMMSNHYMMVFLFLVFYLAWRGQGEGKKSIDFHIASGIFAAVLSTLRMEGGMILCFLILCISLLTYGNKRLLFVYLLPLALIQGAYYTKIFMFMELNPAYQFLSKEKAWIQMGIIAALFIYLSFIRHRLPWNLEQQMPGIILGGLAFGNLLLLLLNPIIYIENIKAFAANFFHQSGWGFFVCFVFILLLSLPMEQYHFGYMDLVWTGYFLLGVAVCWARDGMLREGVGDSGNKVMLQAVPFIIYAMTMRVVGCLREKNE